MIYFIVDLISSSGMPVSGKDTHEISSRWPKSIIVFPYATVRSL